MARWEVWTVGFVLAWQPPAAAQGTARQPERPFFEFSLSEAEPAAVPPLARPPAIPLDEARTRALLSRLPPLRPDSAPPASPLRPKSLPPPRAGAVQLAPFPPPPAAAARPAMAVPPLRLLRRAPEGEVEVAARLSLAFSQPMVAIAEGNRQVSAPPARIVPAPPGRWRWLTTNVLVFEPDGRFPMATEYRVEVPAGTRSVSGGVLESAEAWTFTTPPPSLVTSGPRGGPTRRDPVLFAAFDQRIDPQAVLGRLRLDGGAPLPPLRLATADEVAADGEARLSKVDTPEGRFVAFRAAVPLPAGLDVRVDVESGTPSAEGPLPTTKAQGWSFRTHGAFRVVDRECRPKECLAGASFAVRLSNPILADAFREEMVRVEPPLEDLSVSVAGDTLTVSGDTRAGVTHRVALDPALPDVFGQTLGEAPPETFLLSSPPPRPAAKPPAPAIWSQGREIAVLDPAGPHRYSVFSRGFESLRVRIFAVEPEDFGGFSCGPGAKPPGREASSLTVATDPQAITESPVDVGPALTDGLGHALLVAEPSRQAADAASGRRLCVWLESTRLILDAFADDTSLTVSASDLDDATPLADVALRLLPSGIAATTGSDGLARLDLGTGGDRALVARRGRDAAVLPAGEKRWSRHPAPGALRFYVFDAQRLYRPGDTVELKGVVRLAGGGPRGDLELPSAVARQVSYRLEDSQGNEIAKGERALAPNGAFELSLKLPPTANLGTARLHLEADAPETVGGRREEHEVEIQEFRRPEYEVSASAGEELHVSGGAAHLTLSASYYSGGALGDAPVRWEVTARRGGYQPPGTEGFFFGSRWPSPGAGPDAVERTLEGRTSARGAHVLRIDLLGGASAGPVELHAQGTVEDVNRQSRTASVALLVHPALLYVGLRTTRLFAWQGNGPAVADVIVTDLAGRRMPDRSVRVHLERLDFRQVAGTWRAVVLESQEREVRSAAEPVRCEFPAGRRGNYRFTASVEDDAGRIHSSSADLFGLWSDAAAGDRQAPALTLVADKDRYRPGETAEILVEAPLDDATGVLTLRRSGVLRSERFTMSGGRHTLRLPIEDGFTPNLHLQVDLVGRARRPDGAPARPGWAGLRSLRGAIELAIPPEHRGLRLAVSSRDSEVAPGAGTAVDVTLADSAGGPVGGADVAVAVVDESLLSLALAAARGDDDRPSGQDAEDAVWDLFVPDPLGVFYEPREPGVEQTGLRRFIARAGPRKTAGSLEQYGPIQHERIGCFVAGEFPLVDATIEPAADVARARVYYKSALGPAYYFVEMVLEDDRFVGKLPKPALSASPITYYIQATTTLFEESQTPEIEAAVVADEADCAGGRVAEIGPPGAVTVFSAATAFAALAVGFAAGGLMATEGAAIPLRSDFRALALFAPHVQTDARGRASVDLVLPGNLTRYRVLALAAAGNRFGRGQSSLLARLPLTVRPSPPRFLGVGDRFELPVVVHNETDAPLEAEVAVRAQNAPLAGPAGRRVRVPANDRVEVLFPMTAGRPGEVRLQAAAAAGAFADAAERSLPVWAPATSEAFAVYGQVDEGAVVQPIGVPRDVRPDVGGLEIGTSATALAALTDAFLYLRGYPFECSEQLASRVLAVAALRDVLAAFRARSLPPAAEVVASVARDIERLRQLQDDDGGFGFWRRGEERRWPYLGVHVAHALARAKAKGFEVPEEMLDRSRGYLRSIEDKIPAGYGFEARRALIAYALYARFQLGDIDRRAARVLVGEDPSLDPLSLESLGWMLSVLTGDPESAPQLASIRAQLGNRVTETAAAAHFVDSYDDDGPLLLHSSRRADAAILEALIADQPRSDLVPRLVEGLLGQRRAGRWESTQENAFVLLALDRYFRAYEKASPDFVARLWLGPSYAGEHAFRGRNGDRRASDVPMAALLGLSGESDLVIEKRGRGRLYYRIGLEYAPASLPLEPLRNGFSVERRYEAVDDAGDVASEADRTVSIRAGARVRVRVRMTVPAVRHHVALVDPLPAGLEILNPELDATGSDPSDDSEPADDAHWWRSWGCWFEHQNLRDERAEAFASRLDAGVYDYSYLARATTPGEFVAGAPRAEEMYHPETFGRGVPVRVVVR